MVHRKRIHILVIIAYLLYTIYEADWQLRQAGDFYQHLGVSHAVEDRGLQSRFRRLYALTLLTSEIHLTWLVSGL